MIAVPAAMPPSTPSQGPELRDIHLPPDPSWWPPAWGWWLLGVLILGVLLLLAWCWRRYRREVRQRRRVLAGLDALVARHQHDGDHAALAGGLQQLLRRVARQHDPQAAQQRGEAWRLTLARMPLDAAAQSTLLALDRQIYQPRPVFDHAAAVQATRQWLQLALRQRHWKRKPVAVPVDVEPDHA